MPLPRTCVWTRPVRTLTTGLIVVAGLAFASSGCQPIADEEPVSPPELESSAPGELVITPGVALPSKTAKGDLDLAGGVEASLRLSPKVGAERVWAISSKGSVSMDYAQWATNLKPGAEASASPTESMVRAHRYEVEAELHSRVVGREGDVWLMAMRLAETRYVVDGQLEDRTAFLQAPFVAEIDAEGRFVRMRFPVGFPAELEGAIRAVVEPMQVTLAPGAQASWERKETSAQGQSTVAYRVEEVDEGEGVIRVKRTLRDARRKGAELAGVGAAPEHHAATVDASSGEVVWATDGSGLVSISFEDEVTTLVRISPLSEERQSYQARRVERALVELPSSAEDALSGLADPSWARRSLYHIPVQAQARLAKIDSLEAMLERFFSRVDENASEVAYELKYFLRANPKMVAALADALDAFPYTEENFRRVGVAWTAIGAAGHKEAQELLAQVLGSSRYSVMSRDRALRATLSITLPMEVLLPAVWSYREALPRTGRTWHQGLSIATNIYGALGGWEKMSPANTERVVEVLGERLQTTDDRMEKLMMLVALGNVGDLDKVLPLTQPYLTSSDEALRGRAYHTFQKAPGDEAFTTFARYYQKEQSLSVLRLASGVAESAPYSEARNSWAQAQSRMTEDEIVLARVVRMLAAELERHPENEEVLREMLSRVDNRNVRKTIYRYVSPTAGGAR